MMSGMSYNSFERLHSNTSLCDMTGSKHYTFSESLGKKYQVTTLETNLDVGFSMVSS